MKRKLIERFIELKNKHKRIKSLGIYRARQVGKTYLVREIAKDNYDYLYSHFYYKR